ncbi:MAG: hypothetical protein IBX60_07200, partial [Candidatus Aminicenantes bacterium]|nr:hypothetical protein [Candidatus Aminicenantes bacterium]
GTDYFLGHPQVPGAIHCLLMGDPNNLANNLQQLGNPGQEFIEEVESAVLKNTQ